MAAQFGAMVKRMHAGHAAESGIVACELARRGFSGPLAGAAAGGAALENRELHRVCM